MSTRGTTVIEPAQLDIIKSHAWLMLVDALHNNGGRANPTVQQLIDTAIDEAFARGMLENAAEHQAVLATTEKRHNDQKDRYAQVLIHGLMRGLGLQVLSLNLLDLEVTNELLHVTMDNGVISYTRVSPP